MKRLMSILAIVVFVWLFGIYHFKYSIGWVESLFYSLSIFFGNLKELNNFSTIDYIPAILGLLVVIWAVVVLYLKLFGQSIKRWWVLNFTNPILVIGLGDGNSSYIDSELQSGNSNIIAIERDSTNLNLQKFKDRVVCINTDAKDAIKDIDFKNIKHTVISVGDDLSNIATAKELLLSYSTLEIYLHINSPVYRDINFIKGVIDNKNIHIFSYYEASARELFTKEAIVDSQIMQSLDSYAVALIADLEFVLGLVYEIAIVGQLPNGNILKLYIVNQKSKDIKEALELHYNIENIKSLNIEYIDAEYKDKSFYDLGFWRDNNLSHIILCNKDIDDNIKTLSLLNQHIYIDDILNDRFRIKIDVAISNSSVLSEALESGNSLFKNIDIFAQSKEVNSKENIIAKKRDMLAVGVDFVYSNIGAKLVDYDNYRYSYYFYNSSKELDLNQYIEINDLNWDSLSYFHKESNRAVADHIATKLGFLGLGIKRSNMNNIEKLFNNNAQLFYSVLTDEKRVKLAISEHNRWMAFHYLHNFKHIDFIPYKLKKEKKDFYESKKEHMCLIPFEEFKQRSKELEELGYTKGGFESHDMMIVEMIPHIVSYARFEIFRLSNLGSI